MKSETNSKEHADRCSYSLELEQPERKQQEMQWTAYASEEEAMERECVHPR